MASSPQSFNKRQREQAKREKAAAKRARRQSRSDDTPEEVVDEDALLERFRVLNEQRADGKINAEDFETQRQEIFALLGLGEE